MKQITHLKLPINLSQRELSKRYNDNDLNKTFVQICDDEKLIDIDRIQILVRMSIRNDIQPNWNR
jgi:hypothetical protein